MNLKIKNIFIGENVIISNNGQFSLINNISIITAKNFPAIHQKLTILVNTIGDLGSYKERVEIFNEKTKKVVAFTEGDISIKDEWGNYFLASFNNIPFENDGKFLIKVFLNDIEYKNNNTENYIILIRDA